MSHIPQHATGYTIDVTEEDTARGIAAVLIERGYAVVSLGPRISGRGLAALAAGPCWRVVGVDQGPYPDDDVDWWMATEERVIAGLVRASGGCYFCARTHSTTARVLVQGDLVVDRDLGEVGDLRLAALAREPARARRPVIVHRLKPSEARTAPGGEPVALNGLDGIDWGSLSHAYGPAEDVPAILRALAANDASWEEARYWYFSAVVHQDTCYSATPRTIEFLVQLACAPELTGDYRTCLLDDLVYLATLDPTPAGEGVTNHSHTYQTLTCQEVIDRLPRMLALWPWASALARAWLTVLAALVPSTASGVLAELREFRRGIRGPSPALDLALALVTHDHEHVLDLTLEAAAWDERVPALLEADAPLRARHLKVLAHLAAVELT